MAQGNLRRGCPAQPQTVHRYIQVPVRGASPAAGENQGPGSRVQGRIANTALTDIHKRISTTPARGRSMELAALTLKTGVVLPEEAGPQTRTEDARGHRGPESASASPRETPMAICLRSAVPKADGMDARQPCEAASPADSGHERRELLG